MEIGKKIAFLRKQQNYTQEQLANGVGVSIPAVSKWETGATAPDISLLAPIARMLHTDVNELLSFRKDISEQEVDHFMAELQEICVKQGYQTGMERAFEFQKEYPNDNYLKLKTANAVTMYAFTIKEVEEEEKVFLNYLEQSTRLYEEVYQDEKLYDKFGFRQAAAIALSGRYIQNGKFQEAENILKNLSSEGVDTAHMHMLAQVYLKQGKTKDARKYIHKTRVRDLINLLLDIRTLFDASMKEGNFNEALSFAKEYYQLRTMMPILNWMHPSELLVEVYLNMKDLEMAEQHFCHYVDEIIETLRLSQDTFVIPFFKINVYRIVTENPLYQPLLERPACREKLKKLCKLSEKEIQ